ncbi:MAG TPA: hypothetical protein VIL72_12100 [Beijerinckiaceae bacterium]|jgi:hypothetical protein
MAVSRTLKTASIGAVAFAGALAATAAPASAKWGRNAALFGGLAAGAIVAGAVASSAYAAPAYYGPACWREKRPVYNRFGDFVGYRSIRVCD